MPRNTPAAVTRIDYDMIWSSGARNLNELVDIYVPNTEIIRHHFSFDHIVTRGLVSDLEDKYLLLVNGRVMNHHTFEGVFSERDLPMLGDIHHIDYIRGPGSAIYGPGAIAGVVNLVTHNGLTFQGTDVTVRQGAVDTFTSLEIRHGMKLTDTSGLFFYYGMTDYVGADQFDAPFVFGKSFNTPAGFPPIRAGEPARIPDFFANDHQGYRSMVKHKAYAQYTNGNFDLWVRYTRGGEHSGPFRGLLGVPPIGFLQPDQFLEQNGVTDSFQFGYQQLSVYSQYTHEFNEKLSAEVSFGYDMFDYERLNFAMNPETHHREDEYYSRFLTRWKPNEHHAIAVGTEVSREIHGLDSPGFPHLPAVTRFQGSVGLPWYTTAYAFLGEYQWKPNDQWTTFLGGRVDKHTFTDWLFSPRGAVVYTPTEEDTLKFIATEAVRRLPDDSLRGQFLGTGEFADTESIKSLELRYERKLSEPLMLALSAFHQDSAFVGFTGRPRPIEQEQFADVETWGLELEASYRTENTRLVASHAYTKLIDFALKDPTIIQGFSAQPYGIGNDLANFSPHSTKFAMYYDHCHRWRSSMSLRIYWQFPGDRDTTALNNKLFAATGVPQFPLGLSDPGYEKAFRGNYYLNYGLEYRASEHLTFRLDLLNLLGWFDKDLNKRNFIFQSSDFRSEAAAIGLSVRAGF